MRIREAQWTIFSATIGERKYKVSSVCNIVCLMLRRASLPLDILGLPGYESLSQPEKDLCSSIRQAKDQSMSIFTNMNSDLFSLL
jgi:hypothetical protein